MLVQFFRNVAVLRLHARLQLLPWTRVFLQIAQQITQELLLNVQQVNGMLLWHDARQARAKECPVIEQGFPKMRLACKVPVDRVQNVLEHDGGIRPRIHLRPLLKRLGMRHHQRHVSKRRVKKVK